MKFRMTIWILLVVKGLDSFKNSIKCVKNKINVKKIGFLKRKSIGMVSKSIMRSSVSHGVAQSTKRAFCIPKLLGSNSTLLAICLNDKRVTIFYREFMKEKKINLFPVLLKPCK